MSAAPHRAWLVVGALLVCCGCRPVLTQPSVAPVVAGDTWGRWRTLRAEHKVTVTARSAEGKEEQRTLRGVIAVERPARFRLRALGPGGITLFDLLYDEGQASVLQSLRDPQGELFSRLLSSIAGDLAAAYDLRPRPAADAGGRKVSLAGSEVVVEERDRTVRLADFRDTGRGPAPARMAIVNPGAGYRVAIEAQGTVLDEALDPALFAPPAK